MLCRKITRFPVIVFHTRHLFLLIIWLQLIEMYALLWWEFIAGTTLNNWPKWQFAHASTMMRAYCWRLRLINWSGWRFAYASTIIAGDCAKWLVKVASNVRLQCEKDSLLETAFSIQKTRCEQGKRILNFWRSFSRHRYYRKFEQFYVPFTVYHLSKRNIYI